MARARPNGSRLSCGRRARRHKDAGGQSVPARAQPLRFSREQYARQLPAHVRRPTHCSVQPVGDATVMRARASPTPTEAVRAIAAARRGPRKRAVVGSPSGRRHPLAPRVHVSRSRALDDRSRLPAELILGDIASQPAAGDAAPTIRARVEADWSSGVHAAQGRRVREGFRPHRDDRGGVSERVRRAQCVLSTSGRQWERQTEDGENTG